ncbi:MAG: hypothetical protein HY698_00215 [Deltaproteobacteria bacterium]|nr:hypothetical protein [Deltaproteobacteria bacterium]
MSWSRVVFVEATLGLATSMLIASGCGGGDKDKPSGGQATIEGAVQKGPFVVGSSVHVSVLDEHLNPTGQVFNTSTINDRGEFKASVPASGPVALEGVGFYYNEVKGALSGSSLTLRAFYVPSGPGNQKAYVNLLTHLTGPRIQALVQGGTAFDAAVKQAETELMGEMNITSPGFAPTSRATEMNMAGGDTDDNAYLLCVSSVLAQVAVLRAGGPDQVDATLQELINSTALAFAGGTLPTQLKTDVTSALQAMDVGNIERKLGERLAQIGSTENAPDMDRVLDQDRDGIRNLGDKCPLASDPDQLDKDADDKGDACDECPATFCRDQCKPADKASGRMTDSCFRACTTQEECPAGELCVMSGLTSRDGSTTGICGPPCDPRKQGACEGDLACVRRLAAGPVTLASGSWACLPPAFRGVLPLGSSCIGSGASFDPCGSGLACGEGGEFPYIACRAICDPSSKTGCDGRPCVAWNANSATGDPASWGFELGLCELPPGSEGDACFVSSWASPEGRTSLLDSCGPNLACASSEACQLVEGMRFLCCVPAGGKGEACFALDMSKPDWTRCNDGLTCVNQGCGNGLDACCQ